MKKHEEISKKIIALMGKNNIDTYTTSSLTYGSLCIYSIETDGHEIQYEGCDDDYRTLTDVDALTELYDEMRLEYEDVHISELTKEEVNDLACSIVWNSIFVSDYENVYGVKAKMVSYYADGFLEFLNEEMESYDEVLHYVNTCAVGERFYNYIQSIEVE